MSIPNTTSLHFIGLVNYVDDEIKPLFNGSYQECDDKIDTYWNKYPNAVIDIYQRNDR